MGAAKPALQSDLGREQVLAAGFEHWDRSGVGLKDVRVWQGRVVHERAPGVFGVLRAPLFSGNRQTGTHGSHFRWWVD